jgi:arylsulfatase A-like enzyme
MRRGVGLAAAATITAALLPGCASSPPPNILLVVIDTARADVFGFDGDRRGTSPSLDRIAAEGAVYERAYAPAPWTVPSHASLFTGLLPSAHGTDAGHLHLDDSLTTLAESLHAAGYHTLGYTENPWVGKEYGFYQGFDHYEEIWRSVHGTEGDMGAERVGGLIERWLDWRAAHRDAGRQPFFIFINYFEPHLPYNPPQPERDRFLVPPVDRPAVDRLRRLKHPHEMPFVLGLQPLPAEDARVLRQLYAGEIAYVDRRIGELAAMLRRHRLLDRTVVAVTADHGEMLGEHGLLDHKLNVDEPLLRIPMILRYPAAVRAGQRIADPVMLQDLHPTLLRLAGIRAALPGEGMAARRPDGSVFPPQSAILPGVRGIPGRPRAALLEGAPVPLVAEYARPLPFLEVIKQILPQTDVPRWDRALVAWRVGDLKLHWASDGRHRLFDLARDPGEDHDLAASEPDRVAALAARVDAWLRRPGARPPLGHPAAP